MTNRAFGTFHASATALLLLLPCAAAAPAQEAARHAPAAAGTIAAAPLSDERIVKDLTAADGATATRAVGEVLARGGRMIPHLLKLKGDRRCFAGDMALGSHAGCSLRFAPDDRAKGCYESSGSSTVEVAALFLIESVYRGGVKFAQGATLVEWEAGGGGQRTDVEYNGRGVIARAWAAAERWSREVEREGLEGLRAKERGPFADTRLGFY